MKSYDAAPSAPTEKDVTDLDAKPPNYESVQRRAGQQRPYVHFSDNITQNVQPSVMATNGMWYPQINTFQYPPQTTNLTFMSN